MLIASYRTYSRIPKNGMVVQYMILSGEGYVYHTHTIDTVRSKNVRNILGL